MYDEIIKISGIILFVIGCLILILLHSDTDPNDDGIFGYSNISKIVPFVIMLSLFMFIYLNYIDAEKNQAKETKAVIEELQEKTYSDYNVYYNGEAKDNKIFDISKLNQENIIIEIDDDKKEIIINDK